jgi:hypothetical protein
MKTIYHLEEPDRDPFLVEKTEPLIIWTIRVGAEVISLPALTALIQKYFFFN